MPNLVEKLLSEHTHMQRTDCSTWTTTVTAYHSCGVSMMAELLRSPFYMSGQSICVLGLATSRVASLGDLKRTYRVTNDTPGERAHAYCCTANRDTLTLNLATRVHNDSCI